MTTQSLRGMDNHGAMHWRGDRNGAIQQSGAPFIDRRRQPGRVGAAERAASSTRRARSSRSTSRSRASSAARTQLSADDMTAFRTFVLQVTYPPNPIRNLDNSLTAEQAAGAAFYFNHARPNGAGAAVGSLPQLQRLPHARSATATRRQTDHPGFFGTDGRLSFEFETQIFKVPHLRNSTRRSACSASRPIATWRHGAAPAQSGSSRSSTRRCPRSAASASSTTARSARSSTSSRRRCSSRRRSARASRDGTVGAGRTRSASRSFTFDAQRQRRTASTSAASRCAARIVVVHAGVRLEHDAPIVGQQVTLTAANASAAQARIALLEARAAAGDCDLVVKGLVQGGEKGYVYSGGVFVSSNGSLSDAQLKALVGACTDALTFTAVPPGSGWRIGLDRNNDGLAD